jgi:hypothetical protein
MFEKKSRTAKPAVPYKKGGKGASDTVPIKAATDFAKKPKSKAKK